MASNTPNLGLLKKDPITDGSDTFNIKSMLNDNWDKIDAAVGEVKEELQDIDVPPASLTEAGIVQLSSATDSTSESMAATSKAIKAAYDEATAAKQAGNDRKAEVVAALVAKGVAASTSDTWAQLISKMTAIIVASGDATAADLLAGKKASNKNGPITGNIPVLTGVRVATGVGQWGDGGLAVYPERGYQKGGLGDGEIKVPTAQLKQADGNLQPYNILAGKNIFGVAGTSQPSQITNEYIKVVGTPSGLISTNNMNNTSLVGLDVNKGLFGVYGSGSPGAFSISQIGADGILRPFLNGNGYSAVLQALRGACGYISDNTWYCGTYNRDKVEVTKINYNPASGFWENTTVLSTIPNVPAYYYDNNSVSLYNNLFYCITAGNTSYTLKVYNTSGVLLNSYTGEYEYELGGGAGTWTYTMPDGKSVITNQNSPQQTMIITANGVVQYFYKVTTNFFDRLKVRDFPTQLIKGLDNRVYLVANAPQTKKPDYTYDNNMGCYAYTGNLY